MSVRYSQEQILEGLVLDVAECLVIEPEEVAPDAKFFSMLDGESIELLDISFRIQKRFGIRARIQEFFHGWEIDSDGRLSAGTEQKLQSEFPLIDWPTRIAAMSGDDPRDLLTVGLLGELLFYSQTANDEKSDGSMTADAALKTAS